MGAWLEYMLGEWLRGVLRVDVEGWLGSAVRVDVKGVVREHGQGRRWGSG